MADFGHPQKFCLECEDDDENDGGEERLLTSIILAKPKEKTSDDRILVILPNSSMKLSKAYIRMADVRTSVNIY